MQSGSEAGQCRHFCEGEEREHNADRIERTDEPRAAQHAGPGEADGSEQQSQQRISRRMASEALQHLQLSDGPSVSPWAAAASLVAPAVQAHQTTQNCRGDHSRMVRTFNGLRLNLRGHALPKGNRSAVSTAPHPAQLSTPHNY